MSNIMEEIEAQIKAKEEPRVYWSCYGIKTKEEQAETDSQCWITVFESAEEAEANAFIHPGPWKWDKEPAHKVNLADLMLIARQRGMLGVRITKYIDGRWKGIREFPSHIPLQENE